MTLVNRDPDAAEEARLVLRDFVFAGPAAVTTLTDGGTVTSGTGPARGALAVSLPPRSFTVLEAPIAARRFA